MSDLSIRTRRWARALSNLTIVVMVALAGGVLAVLVQPELGRQILLDAAPVGSVDREISTGTIYALLAVGVLSVAVQLILFWNMNGLFRLYAAGDALSAACGDYVRRIGLALLVLPATMVIYGMAASVLLSWDNPVGERQLVVSINMQSMGFFIGGALLLLIGITIRQAADIAEENRGFV